VALAALAGVDGDLTDFAPEAGPFAVFVVFVLLPLRPAVAFEALVLVVIVLFPGCRKRNIPPLPGQTRRAGTRTLMLSLYPLSTPPVEIDRVLLRELVVHGMFGFPQQSMGDCQRNLGLRSEGQGG
jgi:hypothetical protein